MMLVGLMHQRLTCPIVFTFYNTPVENQRAIGYYENPKLDLQLARSIITQGVYDRIIAGSQCYYNAAIRLGAVSRKTDLSYLGVDTSRLLKSTKRFDALNLYEYLGGQLVGDEKYVLLPGRIVAQKGILDAVEALSIINGSRPIKLLLTGMAEPFDNVYAKQVKRRVAELGLVNRIVIPKKVIPIDLLPVFYKQAVIVITPSYYEGLGLAAIEALALGCPLVTTNVPGLNEVVMHNYNGLAVAPKNPIKLATAIIRLLDDEILAARFRKAGPLSVHKFDIERHINFLEATYCKLQGTKLWKFSPVSYQRADKARV